jgi:hypothetical protein
LALSRAPGANAKTGLNRQRPSTFRNGKRHGRRPTTPVGFGLWIIVWDLFFAVSKDALKRMHLCDYGVIVRNVRGRVNWNWCPMGAKFIST